MTPTGWAFLKLSDLDLNRAKETLMASVSGYQKAWEYRSMHLGRPGPRDICTSDQLLLRSCSVYCHPAIAPSS
jgi:hypothetical protein